MKSFHSQQSRDSKIFAFFIHVIDIQRNELFCTVCNYEILNYEKQK